MAPTQSAYRVYHSTETALVKVVNDLLMAADGGYGSVLMLLDLSAAFDTVDHTALLERLKNRFSITGSALQWFQSYLSERTQSVSVCGVKSEPLPLMSGVPQGSVLGPTIFTAHLSPVHDVVSRHEINLHTYADDNELYTSFNLLKGDQSDQLAAYRRISDCYDETHDWMTTNKLKMNGDKTELLLVLPSSRRGKGIELETIRVGSHQVTPEECVRNLGITLDSGLSFERHVNEVCRKAYFQIKNIARIRRYLDINATRTLVQALVISTIDYCNALLVGLPESVIGKLQRVQNSAARLILRLGRREHITRHLRDLHWLPVKRRIEFKVLVLVYRCLHGLAPQYLADLVKLRDSTVLTRSAGAKHLLVPKTRTAHYGDRAFCRVGPVLWNSLPPNIRTKESLSTFKSALKTHLFNCPR